MKVEKLIRELIYENIEREEHELFDAFRELDFELWLTALCYYVYDKSTGKFYQVNVDLTDFGLDVDVFEVDIATVDPDFIMYLGGTVAC